MDKQGVYKRVSKTWRTAHVIATHAPQKLRSIRTHLGNLVKEGLIESRQHPTQTLLSGERPLLQFRRK